MGTIQEEGINALRRASLLPPIQMGCARNSKRHLAADWPIGFLHSLTVFNIVVQMHCSVIGVSHCMTSYINLVS